MSTSDGAAPADPRAPRWVRDGGRVAWLLIGIVLLLAGALWLASLAHTIVMPVLAAAVVAAVVSPVIARLQRHGVPRVAATILLLVALVAAGLGLVLVVIGGITSQAGELGDQLASARSTIAGWMTDVGVDPGSAQEAQQDASSAATTSVETLLHGVAEGVSGLSSLVFFLALTLLCLVFLLADGPAIRDWGERHLGVPRPVARAVTTRILQSLRGYFVGVTIVAAFNALVVGAGALVLGVPKAGTIVAVTFLGAYVPYLGAWAAGAFAVLVALGGAGTEAALGMMVIQLLANGVLQQLVQPFAMGAALGVHPLAVLVVTIAGGCLFGAPGLILAAPLTSAAVRLSGDLAAEPAPVAPPPAQAVLRPDPAG